MTDVSAALPAAVQHAVHSALAQSQDAPQGVPADIEARLHRLEASAGGPGAAPPAGAGVRASAQTAVVPAGRNAAAGMEPGRRAALLGLVEMAVEDLEGRLLERFQGQCAPLDEAIKRCVCSAAVLCLRPRRGWLWICLRCRPGPCMFCMFVLASSGRIVARDGMQMTRASISRWFCSSKSGSAGMTAGRHCSQASRAGHEVYGVAVLVSGVGAPMRVCACSIRRCRLSKRLTAELSGAHTMITRAVADQGTATEALRAEVAARMHDEAGAALAVRQDLQASLDRLASNLDKVRRLRAQPLCAGRRHGCA